MFKEGGAGVDDTPEYPTLTACCCTPWEGVTRLLRVYMRERCTNSRHRSKNLASANFTVSLENLTGWHLLPPLATKG